MIQAQIQVHSDRTNTRQHINNGGIIALARALGLLRMFLLFHACTAGAISALGLFQAHVLIIHILYLSSMKVFLKHGIRFDSLELCLEIGDVVTLGAAVGTTPGIGKIVAIILAFLAWVTPVKEYGELRGMKSNIR